MSNRFTDWRLCDDRHVEMLLPVFEIRLTKGTARKIEHELIRLLHKLSVTHKSYVDDGKAMLERTRKAREEGRGIMDDWGEWDADAERDAYGWGSPLHAFLTEQHERIRKKHRQPNGRVVRDWLETTLRLLEQCLDASQRIYDTMKEADFKAFHLHHMNRFGIDGDVYRSIANFALQERHKPNFHKELLSFLETTGNKEAIEIASQAGLDIAQ